MSPADRLIGREPALAAASSVLGDALSGSGQFLMISGEAGIGKTALLAALTRQAGPIPLTLRGFCWEGDGAPPYWPWSQVLRASGLPMAELGEAGWLVRPASGSAELMSAAAAADAQFRLFEAVSRSLSRLAADRPVLLVLDDLHWADEPSLRLLGFLAHALTSQAVLLLGAYRDTEASPELRKLAGTAQQLTLAGLAPAEVETMARELAEAMAEPRPSSQVISQLWQRSGGNPFFVRELTRLLVAQGSWHEQTQIPASVAETLRRRLARLSTECVRLLEWAAVAGRDIDPSLLTQGGMAPNGAEALGLLDEARRAGVIAGTSELRFTHDLYRETILDGLAAPARAAINLSVGRALQARSGPAARVAAHLLAAGAPAQPDALEYSLLAAREAAARLGHEDACAHYLRALQIIEDGGASGGAACERTEILLQLAASHERAGNSNLAMQRFLQAADASRTAGDAVGLAAAALGIQTLGHRSGAQNAELAGLLREASEQLAATGGPLAAQSRVLAALARTMRHGSDRLPGAEVIQTAHRAVALAAAANDASALARAKLAVHDAMWTPGTAVTRLPVIAEMLDAARASGDDDLAAEAHLLRAAALLELGEPAGRDELLTYVTLAGELGHARGRWRALTRQATFAQIAGWAEESARLGEQALELGLAIGEPDAIGCFCTSRWSLVALGVREPPTGMDAADPLWPMFPLLKAWPPAARGEAAEAAAALGNFSVLEHRGVDGHGSTRRGRRRVRGGGLRRPADVGLRAAPPVRRDPRGRRGLCVVPRCRRPPPRRARGLARGHGCRRNALPRGSGDARASRGRRMGPSVGAGTGEAHPGGSGGERAPVGERRAIALLPGQADPAPGLEGPGRPGGPARCPRNRRTCAHPGRAQARTHGCRPGAGRASKGSVQVPAGSPGPGDRGRRRHGQPRASQDAAVRTRCAHPRACRGRRTRRPGPKARR